MTAGEAGIWTTCRLWAGGEEVGGGSIAPESPQCDGRSWKHPNSGDRHSLRHGYSSHNRDKPHGRSQTTSCLSPGCLPWGPSEAHCPGEDTAHCPPRLAQCSTDHSPFGHGCLSKVHVRPGPPPPAQNVGCSPVPSAPFPEGRPLTYNLSGFCSFSISPWYPPLFRVFL